MVRELGAGRDLSGRGRVESSAESNCCAQVARRAPVAIGREETLAARNPRAFANRRGFSMLGNIVTGGDACVCSSGLGLSPLACPPP